MDTPTNLNGISAACVYTGVIDLSMGKTFTDRGKGFTHCLVVRMENRDVVPYYADHPLHQVCVFL